MIGNQERRRVLLAQHERLRVLIAAVSKAAGAVLELPEDAGRRLPVLREAIAALRCDLEDHLVAEEALLGPVLARIDAWGPVRLAQMHAEHAHHRALLAVLRDERPLLEPHALARSAQALAGDVLSEMHDEERDLLSAAVLNDDTVNLDASDA